MTYASKAGTAFAGVVLLALSTGCATKKHVQRVVTPIEEKLGVLEKKSAEHSAQITEANNNLSKIDERVTDVDRKAASAAASADRAGQAAARANDAAMSAGQKADAAKGVADQGLQQVASVRQSFDRTISNLDNYKEVKAERILFKFNSADLTKDAAAQLDTLAGSLAAAKSYVIELQGYTDRAGSSQTNVALADRRTEAVARYLTAKHSVPLRKVNMLGVGPVEKDEAKTREGRTNARRVDVKVYSLDLK